MVKSRLWSITALVVTGLASLGLWAWVWLQGGPSWYRAMPHPAGWLLGPLVIVGLVATTVFWSRHRLTQVDPLGDLALEYVEGRIDRQEFLAREAVLKESL